MININIFCDASVGPELKGACAGSLVETSIDFYEDTNINKEFYALIQPNGTNNSGEIAAIALGVVKAIELYRRYSHQIMRINIFSDSLISIRGIREWMPNWIRNSRDKNGIFMSNSGVVKNQSYFKFIFNSILLNPDIKIHFYHQDGHIVSNFDSILPRFKKFNGIYLNTLNLTASHICINNDYVDKETRKIINQFLTIGDTSGYPIETYFWDLPILSYDGFKVLYDDESAITNYLKSIS